MMETAVLVHRGDVVEVDLWGAKGHEKQNDDRKGIRLCVVVQNEGGNKGPLTIVAPITTIKQYKGYTMQVDVQGADQRGPLDQDSIIECGHLRSIDRRERIRRNLGPLPASVLTLVANSGACRGWRR